MFYAKVTGIHGERPNFYIKFNFPDRDGIQQERRLFAPELTAYDFESFRRDMNSFYVVFKSLADARSGWNYYRLYDVPQNDSNRSHYLYMGIENKQQVGIDRFRTPSLRAILEENCSKSGEIALGEDKLKGLYPELREASRPLRAAGSERAPLAGAGRRGEGAAALASRAPGEARDRKSWSDKEDERREARGVAATTVAEPTRPFLSDEERDEMRFATAVRRQKAEEHSWKKKVADTMAKVRHNGFAALADM